MIPLSLYVHWPWCLKKCPYCDFNSYSKSQKDIPEERYVDCLKKAFLHQLPWVKDRTIETIFFGGGTPSLMKASSIESILSFISQNAQISSTAEITLEANPGTLNSESYRAFRQSGINRLSIGVQSFDDRKLQCLGRIHSKEVALTAIREAQQEFDNINIDLMFGLPTQGLEDLCSDLSLAVSMNSTHLSYYQLTIEPQTMFAKRPPLNLPSIDLIDQMQEKIETETSKQNFDHYEVSGYAKPGRYCRHNLNYWEFGDYLGVGPGAHGKITYGNKIFRTVSFSHPKKWMNSVESSGGGIKEKYSVIPENLPFEFMLNILRLRKGASKELWEERTLLPWSVVEEKWNQGVKQKLLEPAENRLQTTPLGWQFLNNAQEIFL
ncbi:MAG: radical SAM family heme chaperone HemW [Burkholderiaceae bacterium]|nr:radical SAM family heme chaperone HemW [Burkholderiaceae bacterium]